MELKNLKLVADYITNDLGIKSVKVSVGRGRCSTAYYGKSKWKILLSPYLFIMPDEVQLAEIIHEICHFLTPGKHHSLPFREWEIYWLGQFGLKPLEYKRAYYRKLELYNGKKINNR